MVIIKIQYRCSNKDSTVRNGLDSQPTHPEFGPGNDQQGGLARAATTVAIREPAALRAAGSLFLLTSNGYAVYGSTNNNNNYNNNNYNYNYNYNYNCDDEDGNEGTAAEFADENEIRHRFY